MVNFVENEELNNSFKGELIENELYQSADNVVDSKNDTYSDPIAHGSKWKQKIGAGKRPLLVSFKFANTIGNQVNKW